MSMEFFEAAANWAVRRNVVCVFERDEYDGWYARVQMSDGRGPFSAQVDEMFRHPKDRGKPAETADEFEDRVSKRLANAVVAARKRRMGVREDAMEAA